jgi:hypothetical protein
VLLIAWLVATILTVLPSFNAEGKTHKVDTNPLRWLNRQLSVVVLPTLVFWLIASSDQLFDWNLDAFPLGYFLGILVFWASGLFLRAWWLRHTPDVETNKAFHEWVEQLKEREARIYLFGKNEFFGKRAFFRAWIWAGLGFLLLLAAFVFTQAFAAVTARALDGQSASVLATVALALAMSQVLYWVGQVVYWRLLNEQGTSLPVRYALFGDQVVRFMLSTWMVFFAFFVVMEQGTINIRETLSVIVIALALIGFMAAVVWPFASWRVRFRDERRLQLTRFAFLMGRIESAFKHAPVPVAASATGPDVAGIDLETHATHYSSSALQKSFRELEALFMEIIRQSRFRCYVALHAHKPDRRAALKPAFEKASALYAVWYANDEKRRTPHEIIKDPATGESPADARTLIEDLKALTSNQNPPFTPFERFLVERAFAEKRMRAALSLGDVPTLSDMVRLHLKQLEESDYRYRIMRWSGRVMTRFDRPEWLRGFAAEAKGDIENRLQRVDRRSLLLAVSAAAAAGVLAWGFAIYDKDIKDSVREAIAIGSKISQAGSTTPDSSRDGGAPD